LLCLALYTYKSSIPSKTVPFWTRVTKSENGKPAAIWLSNLGSMAYET